MLMLDDLAVEELCHTFRKVCKFLNCGVSCGTFLWKTLLYRTCNTKITSLKVYVSNLVAYLNWTLD